MQERKFLFASAFMVYRVWGNHVRTLLFWAALARTLLLLRERFYVGGSDCERFSIEQHLWLQNALIRAHAQASNPGKHITSMKRFRRCLQLLFAPARVEACKDRLSGTACAGIYLHVYRSSTYYVYSVYIYIHIYCIYNTCMHAYIIYYI